MIYPSVLLIFLPSLAWSSCGCVPQGTCHQELSSPPTLPSGETCLPSWEPCCLNPPSRNILKPPSAKENKLSCLPADLCKHLGSALPVAPCPNPGHVHCLLAVPHGHSSSKSLASKSSIYDHFANQYLTVAPCLASCPGPTLTSAHLETPGIVPPCRVGLKRCLLTLDLALLFANNPIFPFFSSLGRNQEKALMGDPLPPSVDFSSNDFSSVTATASLQPVNVVTPSYHIFSTRSFQSYTTASPLAFNEASKPSAWLDHPSKEIEETKSFGKQAGRKFVAPLPLSKAVKNPRPHHLEVQQPKSDPSSHSEFTIPKTISKVGQKEAPVGFLQDLPEDDLVTVLEALKEAIAEVDVD